MNLQELEDKLIEYKIPEEYYSLNGGLPDSRVCVELGKDGRWYTYDSERGSRYDVRVFDSEDEACHDMIRRLIIYRR